MNNAAERQTVDTQRGLRRAVFVVSLVLALLCVWLVPPRLYFQFDRFAAGLPQQFLTFDPDRYLAGAPQRSAGEVALICAAKFLVAFALVWLAYFIAAFIYRGFRPTKT
jgi:hypothetical protein